MPVLVPDRLLVDGALRSGLSVTVESGRITAVGPAPAGGERLSGRALLPGFVNAHSHAFQRILRGRTEWRTHAAAADDFWTWREQMYLAALHMTPQDVEDISRMAFVEMVRAGITVVGEFHYLHQQPDGTPYDDPDELAHRVIVAARDAGIEIVLLRVGYARAGFGKPPEVRQDRFYERSPDDVLAAVERLGREVKVGVAPHSVRAAPLEWLRTLGSYAAGHGLPFHMHVAEQARELEACRAEYGLTPVALLAREGLIDRRFTAVHGIHLRPDEASLLGRAGASVCACPTTERNLGDGIFPAALLLSAGANVALGTDSQCQIAPLEDARQLEYHLRLSRQERAILGNAGGDDCPDRLASRLLACATEGGARALGVDAGRIEVGRAAHLVAIDLDDASVACAGDDTLLPAIVFGAERTSVRDVWVGGNRLVKDGHHEGEERARMSYRAALKRVLS